ncbi:MAG: hypothetical protein WC217_03940 [Candidatus Paceibacterota bacterium]|jgi:hypothetical protein
MELERIQKAANDERALGEPVTSESSESMEQAAENPMSKEAALRRLQERLVVERDASEEQSRQEAIVRLQEKLKAQARPEANGPQPEQRSEIKENDFSRQTEQQGELLHDLEMSVGKPSWESGAVTNQDKTNDLLSQKSFKEEKIRGRVTVGALGGGVLSALGGFGAATLGLAESSAAVTAGFLGMASFAGAALVIPPALYAWHKYKQSRRNKEFEQIYKKQPSAANTHRSVWGLA